MMHATICKRSKKNIKQTVYHEWLMIAGSIQIACISQVIHKNDFLDISSVSINTDI